MEDSPAPGCILAPLLPVSVAQRRSRDRVCWQPGALQELCNVLSIPQGKIKLSFTAPVSALLISLMQMSF